MDSVIGVRLRPQELRGRDKVLVSEETQWLFMSEETNDLSWSCLLLPAGWLILDEVGPAEGEVYGVARQLAWSDGFGWSGTQSRG